MSAVITSKRAFLEVSRRLVEAERADNGHLAVDLRGASVGMAQRAA